MLLIQQIVNGLMLGSVYVTVAAAIAASLAVVRFTFRDLRARHGDSTAHAIPLVSSLGFLLVLESLVRIGRGLRAIAENPDAAGILGVDTNRAAPVVFMLTGLLCGLAGSLLAVNCGEVSPQMGEDIGSKAIAGMAVGGLGSLWGAVAGDVVIGLIEMPTIHFVGADTVQATVWGALLLTLLIRPQGLFGRNVTSKGKL
ncbi:MAG: branched-chain amino acid ABC transporter permease [Pseudomonadota bacterium]|nr:branched-chain amino acid ABC transporter permease [Pseudomonadota bacterium]MEE3101194.1 branched-chain amino acid ABC transporter permease [Pseudomonadota bacterium]